MNKKAQLDEINPAYAGLALVAGLIGFFVASRASEGMGIPIIAGIGSVAIAYIYLVMTDR